MKKLFKLSRLTALMLIFCMIVSVPVSATNYNNYSTAKFKVIYNSKTVTVMYKGKSAAIKTLKKYWGTPKTTKTQYHTTYTFKKGKSSIEVAPYSGGYGLTIIAKDKNVKINGVYVGMTKAVALKSLRSSFGKSYVKLGRSNFDRYSSGKGVTCIQVWYGGFAPTEFQYNSKGIITKIRFFRS